MTTDMVAVIIAAAVTAIGAVLAAALPAMISASRTVKRELTPNGGGSIKDVVHRLEESLTAHLIDAAEEKGRLAALERYVYQERGR